MKKRIINLKGGKKVKRLRPLSSYKNKAWSLLSLIIRRGAADQYGRVSCFTCGELKMWKDIQGGHYKHGHYKKTFLMIENVRPQCVRCNKWMNGNLSVYGQKLEAETPGILDKLEMLSHEPFKPTREYYEEQISLLKEKAKFFAD